MIGGAVVELVWINELLMAEECSKYIFTYFVSYYNKKVHEYLFQEFIILFLFWKSNFRHYFSIDICICFKIYINLIWLRI